MSCLATRRNILLALLIAFLELLHHTASSDAMAKADHAAGADDQPSSPVPPAGAPRASHGLGLISQAS